MNLRADRRGPPRHLVALALFAALAGWGTAVGAETNAPSAARLADRGHDRASNYLLRSADRFDLWLSGMGSPKRRRDPVYDRILGDRSVESSDQASRIKLVPRLTLRDGEGLKSGIDFNASLDLPRCEHRLQLVVQNIAEDDDLLDTQDLNQTRRAPLEDEKDGAVSLRLRLNEIWTFKPVASAGLSFRPEPVPRTKLSLRAKRVDGEYAQRLTQSFFWDGEDGFGERTSVDFIRAATNRYLLRHTVAAQWSETSEGVQAATTLAGYRFISRRNLVGLKLGVSAHVEPHGQVDLYTVRPVYRRRLHSHWLFLQVETGVDFPREREYRETPFIELKFDIIFGGRHHGMTAEQAEQMGPGY